MLPHNLIVLLVTWVSLCTPYTYWPQYAGDSYGSRYARLPEGDHSLACGNSSSQIILTSISQFYFSSDLADRSFAFSEGVLYFLLDEEVIALEVSTRKTLWSKTIVTYPDELTLIALGDSTLYVFSGPLFQCLDITSGNELYTFSLFLPSERPRGLTIDNENDFVLVLSNTSLYGFTDSRNRRLEWVHVIYGSIQPAKPIVSKPDRIAYIRTSNENPNYSTLFGMSIRKSGTIVRNITNFRGEVFGSLENGNLIVNRRPSPNDHYTVDLFDPSMGSVFGSMIGWKAVATWENSLILIYERYQLLGFFNENLKMSWSFGLSDLNRSSLASTDGEMIFIQNPNSLIAFHIATRSEIWKIEYSGTPQSVIHSPIPTGSNYILTPRSLNGTTPTMLKISRCLDRGFCKSSQPDRCTCAKKNWYGIDCDVYCDETICNASLGRFSRCNSDGICICAENYYGPHCNIFCNETECKTKRSSLAECDCSGICRCRANYYGQHCNVYCTERGRFVDEVCVCMDGWFGQGCSFYCNATESCSGNGVCSENGACLCLNTYYYFYEGPGCGISRLNVPLVAVTILCVIFLLAIMSLLFIVKFMSRRRKYQYVE